QVRGHVLKNPQAFTDSEMETVKALYPRQDKFAELLKEDAKRFQEAVAKTGAPLTAMEPSVALALRFEAELDLPLAAAEAGATPTDLLKALERSPHLAKQLGPLRLEGGTIQRQVFVDAFADITRAVKLGDFLEPRNTTYVKLIHQCDALLKKGDAATAIR